MSEAHTVTFADEPTGAEVPAPAAVAEEKVANAPATPAADADPSLVKSAQDMRAEITRLQQELARFKKSADEPTNIVDNGDPDAPKTKEQVTVEAAQKVVEQAGIDVAPYQEEFNETGTLSEASRKKLASGLKNVLGDNAEALINDFVEGQALRLNHYRNAVMEVAGGEEQYASLMAWAATNLSDGEKDAYDRAVDSGDINAARMAVNAIVASYAKANGQPPNLIEGMNAADMSGAFSSAFEMRQAMTKTNEKGEVLYKVDPKYRAAVVRRVMASNF